MTMFKKYNTSRYRIALDTVMRELLKNQPLAIIEFIEMHFNETAILAHFNNDTCLKMHLDTLKRQLHQYKETIGKTKTHEKFTKFTMQHASGIIKKGYDAFSKLKLRGGAPGDEDESSSPPPPPPPPEPEPDLCPVCLGDLDDGTLTIHPIRCPMHKAHSACLRSWWRRNPICPACRTPGHLPPLLPEEEQDEQARISQDEELLQQQLAHDFQLQQQQIEQDAQAFQLHQQQQHEAWQLQWQQQQQQEQQQQNADYDAMQQQRQAERRQWRNARLAFVAGLFGYVFYNLESIMEIAMQVAMEVDPTMSAMEWAIGEFVIISMLLAVFIVDDEDIASFGAGERDED
jgi:hypothetical protein